MENSLAKFLGGFRQSRSREYLLTTRLVHDLGVAAAVSGYDLLVYLPTVDADGFDVIFDDRDRLVASNSSQEWHTVALRDGRSGDHS